MQSVVTLEQKLSKGYPHLKLQVVDCSKLEPYIYWGLAVICATHRLCGKKIDLGIAP
jgi:hypothetical protein